MISLSPEEKKAVKSAIQEMSDCMLRVDAEKELMAEIVKVTHEKYGVEKKHFRKLATIYHKANMDEVRTENDDIETLYEVLFK